MRLPESHREHVRRLLELEQPKREAFVEAAREVPSRPYMVQVEEDILQSSGLSAEVVRPILTVVGSLLRTWEQRSTDFSSLEEFIDKIIEVIQSSELTTEPESAERIEQLREFFKKSLSARSLVLTSRANDVLLEHERTFTGARILTDLRPIFSEEDPPEPTAGVVVHSLKIETERAERSEPFFVGLDDSDLRKLKAVVDRAIEKGQALRARMRDQGFESIEGRGGDT